MFLKTKFILQQMSSFQVKSDDRKFYSENPIERISLFFITNRKKELSGIKNIVAISRNETS